MESGYNLQEVLNLVSIIEDSSARSASLDLFIFKICLKLKTNKGTGFPYLLSPNLNSSTDDEDDSNLETNFTAMSLES